MFGSLDIVFRFFVTILATAAVFTFIVKLLLAIMLIATLILVMLKSM